jgi:hypothetical protein
MELVAVDGILDCCVCISLLSMKISLPILWHISACNTDTYTIRAYIIILRLYCDWVKMM